MLQQRDLSHVGLIEITKQYPAFTTDEVILFNRSHISEEDAIRYVETDNYSKDVLCISKKQWRSLFLNQTEEE